MKAKAQFKTASALHEDRIMTHRTYVRIDMESLIADGGQIEVNNDEELVFSFNSIPYECDSLISAMQTMKLSERDMDDVLENISRDVQQKAFKKYIKS